MKPSAVLIVAVMGSLAPLSGICAEETTAMTQQDTSGLVKKKLQLLDRLIHDSPLAQRIGAQGTLEATQTLEQSEQHYQQAQQALTDGDVQQAEQLISAGLAAAGKASRLTANTQKQAEEERIRYQELADRVQSFSEAFQRVIQEKGEQVTRFLDSTRLERLRRQAESFAQAGNYREANKIMFEAAHLTEVGLSEARKFDTLVHTLTFATPEDEYHYELERYRSHVMLVDFMLGNKSLADAAQGMVAQLVERGNTSQAQAQTAAQEQDFTTAISHLEQGTKELVRALRLGGIMIP